MNEPGLVAETLFDEPILVVAGSESRWAKRRNLTLADLLGEPWVLAQSGSLARSLHDQVFRNGDLEPPSATAVTVSLHLYMRPIETGRWIGLVPASVMRFGGKRMRLKVLPVKTLSPVGFITVKERTLTPLAERFIDCARKVAKSGVGRASSGLPNGTNTVFAPNVNFQGETFHCATVRMPQAGRHRLSCSATLSRVLISRTSETEGQFGPPVRSMTIARFDFENKLEFDRHAKGQACDT